MLETVKMMVSKNLFLNDELNKCILCYGVNCVPLKFSVMVYGVGGLWKVKGLDEVVKVALMMGLVPL